MATLTRSRSLGHGGGERMRSSSRGHGGGGMNGYGGMVDHSCECGFRCLVIRSMPVCILCLIFLPPVLSFLSGFPRSRFSSLFVSVLPVCFSVPCPVCLFFPVCISVPCPYLRPLSVLLFLFAVSFPIRVYLPSRLSSVSHRLSLPFSRVEVVVFPYPFILPASIFISLPVFPISTFLAFPDARKLNFTLCTDYSSCLVS